MIQTKTVEYAKEVDDVAVLLVNIVRQARAGKGVSEIASGAVTDLVNALAGIDQLDDEAETNRKVVLQTIGYRSGELADAILGEKPLTVPAKA